MVPFIKPPTISDDNRSSELYREVAEIFSAKSFDATTMADIAAAVDLTRGGLYYFLRGKQALLFAIMSFAMDLLETEVLYPARRLEAPEECLLTLISGYVDLTLDEPSVMAMLAHQEAGLEKTHRGRIRSRKRLFADFLRDVIAAFLYQERRGAAEDPTAAAATAIDLVESLPIWNVEPKLGRDEVIAHIVERSLGEAESAPPAALAG